jgi:nitrate reductase NapD
MARTHPEIDRRALMMGRLLKADRVIAPPGGEIASILVQARPERLPGVEAAIVALGQPLGPTVAARGDTRNQRGEIVR